MTILAFDPSTTCTGWAVLGDAGDDGKFLGAGMIRPDKFDTLTDRLLDMAEAVRERVRVAGADVVVVETPAATGRARAAQGFKGTPLTIPIYGAAVGAAIVACGSTGKGVKVCGVASDEWTKHRVPTGRDPHKAMRVEYVKRLYGIEDLGPRSLAGNVADAILIARWRLWRERGLV